LPSCFQVTWANWRRMQFAIRKHGTRSPALAAVRSVTYRVNTSVRCAAGQLEPPWDQLTSPNEAFPDQTATWARRQPGRKYDHHQPANDDHAEVVYQLIVSWPFYVYTNDKRRRHYVLWPSVDCLSVLTPISHDAISTYWRISTKLAMIIPHVSGHCWKGFQGRRRSKVKVICAYKSVNAFTAKAYIFYRFICWFLQHLSNSRTHTP